MGLGPAHVAWYETAVPPWWNGRHRRLKISWLLAVPVRVRPGAPDWIYSLIAFFVR